MDSKILDILVCPICKGPLLYERAAAEFICKADRLAFPIQDGIPMMVEESARTLDPNDPLLAR
jgi:uncharacterized protein